MRNMPLNTVLMVFSRVTVSIDSSSMLTHMTSIFAVMQNNVNHSKYRWLTSLKNCVKKQNVPLA